MLSGWRILAWTALVTGLTCNGSAQDRVANTSVATETVASTDVRGQAFVAKPFRLVEDMALRTRWMLLPDAGHPGAPGHMVEISMRDSSDGIGTRTGTNVKQSLDVPTVRAGETLVLANVSADSRIALLAHALSPGRVGDEITARLDLFHTVVRARVLATGHAQMLAPAKAYGREP